MSRWHNPTMWENRTVRALASVPDGRYVAGRLRELADHWGVFVVDVGAIADVCDVDDDLVEQVLEVLSAGRRPWLHRYSAEGREYAAIHDWDAGCAKQFLRDRPACANPAPKEVLERAGCTWLSRDNRTGPAVPELPATPEPPELPARPDGSGGSGKTRPDQTRPNPTQPEPSGGGEILPRRRARPDAPDGAAPTPSSPVAEAWPSEAWPSEAHKASGEAWLAQLSFSSPAYERRVISLARGKPEHFVGAVERMMASAKGWGRKDPVAWLARECDLVAEDAADSATRRRRNGQRASPLPAPLPFEPEPWRAEADAAAELIASALAAAGPTRRQKATMAAAILRDLEAPPEVVAELVEALVAAHRDPPTADQVAEWDEYVSSLEVEAYDRQHWLEPLRLVAVAGDEVHVAAPDRAHADWVSEQGWIPRRCRWVTGVEVIA